MVHHVNNKKKIVYYKKINNESIDKVLDRDRFMWSLDDCFCDVEPMFL